MTAPQPAFCSPFAPAARTRASPRVLCSASQPSSSRVALASSREAPLNTLPVAREPTPLEPTPLERTPREPVRVISGLDEYLQAIESSRHTLMVLKVFAPWCRSCRALTPKLNRLAREFPRVRFFKMNFELNRQLCARLGVRSMPTFILYYGAAGEVDKFSCGPMRADVLRTKVLHYVDGVCKLP